MFSGFAAPFAVFVKSDFIFGIGSVSRADIVSGFANCALQTHILSVIFFSHGGNCTRERYLLQLFDKKAKVGL